MKITETDLKHTPLRLKENDIKLQVKNYLALKGIFSFPLTQGLGSYRGAPDRIIHLGGKAIYLEIKLPTGKMSEWQLAFLEQCTKDGITYLVIRSLEDLQALIENPPQSKSGGFRGRGGTIPRSGSKRGTETKRKEAGNGD